MPDTKRVTVLVGGVRAAAAIVDTTTVKMKTNRDGAQQGSAKCEIDDPINVNVSMFGEAGDTFSVDVSRSEEHTSELQSQFHLVCRLLLEKKNRMIRARAHTL